MKQDEKRRQRETVDVAYIPFRADIATVQALNELARQYDGNRSAAIRASIRQAARQSVQRETSGV